MKLQWREVPASAKEKDLAELAEYMPAVYRQALILRDAGCSYAACAAIVGCTYGTFKHRLVIGRMLLKTLRKACRSDP